MDINNGKINSKKTDTNIVDIISMFKSIPKRKLSEIEKQMIFILIEKSKIEREFSMTILNKGFLIFFAFILVAYFVRLYDIIPELYINALFFLGVLVLIFSMVLYHSVIKKEKSTLNELLESFMK